jgi:hypothetical protein
MKMLTYGCGYGCSAMVQTDRGDGTIIPTCVIPAARKYDGNGHVYASTVMFANKIDNNSYNVEDRSFDKKLEKNVVKSEDGKDKLYIEDKDIVFFE